MKKFVLTIAILALTAGSALAHCGVCGIGDAKGSKDGTKEDRTKAKLEMMTKELGLSEEQSTKLEAAMKAKKEKMKNAKDEFKGELEGILDEEQMMKYKAHKKGSMKDKKGSGHDHDHGEHKEKGSGMEKKGS